MAIQGAAPRALRHLTSINVNKLNAIMEKSRQWHTDKRNFKKDWQDAFLFTEVKSKAVCLVCKQSVAVLKEYNIRRHYETKHSAAFSKYSGEA